MSQRYRKTVKLPLQHRTTLENIKILINSTTDACYNHYYSRKKKKKLLKTPIPNIIALKGNIDTY